MTKHRRPKEHQNNNKMSGYELIYYLFTSTNTIFVIVAAAFFVCALRLSESSTENIMHEMLELLKDYHILGWIIALLTTTGWFATFKLQRVVFNARINELNKTYGNES